jgi:predicted nucleic acid-binding protein
MALDRIPDLVIVDTDILIDAGRGVNEAILFLKRIEDHGSLAMSVITQMELIVGCRDKRELRSIEIFLARFQILQLNQHISRQAVDLLSQYRLSHGLLIADALIAATAMYLQRPLVSKNQRDYRFIAELDLLSYPETFAT